MTDTLSDRSEWPIDISRSITVIFDKASEGEGEKVITTVGCSEGNAVRRRASSLLSESHRDSSQIARLSDLDSPLHFINIREDLYPLNGEVGDE